MWLLLLALPLQGIAAATMLHCGPGHHGMQAADAPMAHHDSAEDSDHHHGEAGHVEAAMHAGNGGDHAPSAADIAKLSKFKCSACASCCLGLALPAAVVALWMLRGMAFNLSRAIAAGLAVGTTGALLGELMCGRDAAHIAVFHLSSWTLAAIAVAALSTRLTRRSFAP